MAVLGGGDGVRPVTVVFSVLEVNYGSVFVVVYEGIELGLGSG